MTDKATNELTFCDSSPTTHKPKIIQAIKKNAVHQICSGQVVLNLAIAVKELVENALDAGATSIEIRLTDFGSKLIEVIDNGCGVEETNFQGLTLKHHTSKLQEFTDLVAVTTFGFRGEALSSLCALGELTVLTRHTEAASATRLKFDHRGKIDGQSPCARQVGTTVSVGNLFAALPVRQKEFHRNLRREFTKMTQLLYAYCLVATNVRISCSNQSGKSGRTTVVSTHGSSTLRENIACVFGSKQLQSVLDLGQVQADAMFRVDGVVSSCAHGQGRGAPDRQFFYINSRPCEPTKLMKLVNEVYRTFNPHQQPFVWLNVTTERSDVDVNVTPDKRQVFIDNETRLLDIVKDSLLKLYENVPSTFQLQNVPRPSISAGSSERPSSLGSVLQSFRNVKRTSEDPPENTASPKQLCITDFLPHKTNTVEHLKPEHVVNSPRNKINNSSSDCVARKRLDIYKAEFNDDNITSCHSDSISSDVSILEDIETRADTLIEDSTSNIAPDCVEQTENVLIIQSEVLQDSCIDIREVDNMHVESSSSKIMTEIEVMDSSLRDEAMEVTGEVRDVSVTEEECKSRTHSSADSVENKLIDDDITHIEDVDTHEDSFVTVSSARCQELKLEFPESSSNQKEEFGKADNVPIEEEECEEKRRLKCHKRPSVWLDVTLEEIKERLKQRQDKKTERETVVRFRAAIDPSKNKSAELELAKEISKPMFKQMEIVGQFNLGFIVTRLGGDLFIIDQHAADEKYNFETLQRTEQLNNQRLVCPIALQLSAVTESVLLDNLDVMRQNGFQFDINLTEESTRRVKLTSIPVSRNWEFGKEDIDELIFMLQDAPGTMCRPSRVRAMFASRACRKSVMIGSALRVSDMRRLVDNLGTLDQPWNCPHGRPTMRHLVNLDLLQSMKQQPT